MSPTYKLVQYACAIQGTKCMEHVGIGSAMDNEVVDVADVASVGVLRPVVL